MSYHVAVDSCTDLNDTLRNDPHVNLVSLTLIIDGENIIDDETFDQASFLDKCKASAKGPTSACPSPEAYREAYGDDDLEAYGITLSAELSGSFNSARVGEAMAKENHPGKQIHVFNSRSATCGQTLILLKIMECKNAGMAFQEVVDTVEQYIGEMTTLFVLESLENLRKNGRLTGLKAALVSVLNIKPVMSSTPEGYVFQLDKARGVKKALNKMVNHIGDLAIRPEEKILGITQCNCPERAECVKRAIEEKYSFKEVIIFEAAGVSSLYAEDGGIVVAF